jgi:hypothetical protein
VGFEGDLGLYLSLSFFPLMHGRVPLRIELENDLSCLQVKLLSRLHVKFMPLNAIFYQSGHCGDYRQSEKRLHWYTSRLVAYRFLKTNSLGREFSKVDSRYAGTAMLLIDDLRNSNDGWIPSGVSSGASSFGKTSSDDDHTGQSLGHPPAETATTEPSLARLRPTASLETDPKNRPSKRRRTTYLCSDCGKQFGTKYDRQVHEQALHMAFSTFFCPYENCKNHNRNPSGFKGKSMPIHLKRIHGITRTVIAEDARMREKIEFLFAAMDEDRARLKKLQKERKVASSVSSHPSRPESQSSTGENSSECDEDLISAHPTREDSDNSSADGHEEHSPSHQGHANSNEWEGRGSSGRGNRDSRDQTGQGSSSQNHRMAQHTLLRHSAAVDVNLRSVQIFDRSQEFFRVGEISQHRDEGEHLSSSDSDSILSDTTEAHGPTQLNGVRHPFLSPAGFAPGSLTAPSSLRTHGSSGSTRSSATPPSLLSEKPAEPKLSQSMPPLRGLYRDGCRPLVIPKRPTGILMQRWYFESKEGATWSPLNSGSSPEIKKGLSTINEDIELESSDDLTLSSVPFVDLSARAEICTNAVNAVDAIFSELQPMVSRDKRRISGSQPENDALEYLSALFSEATLSTTASKTSKRVG